MNTGMKKIIKMEIVGQALRRSLSRATSRGSGQATLELSVALILVLILIVASLRIFLWINQRIVQRQEQYDSQRVTAGSQNMQLMDFASTENKKDLSEGVLAINGEVQVDESGYQKLNVFASPN